MGVPGGDLLSLPKQPGFVGPDNRPKRHTRVRADPADGVFLEAELGRDFSVRCALQGLKYNLPATRDGQSVVTERIATAQNHAPAATGFVNRANADTELVGDAPDGTAIGHCGGDLRGSLGRFLS